MLYTTGAVFNMAITEVAGSLSDCIVVQILNNHEGQVAHATIHLLEVTEEVDFDFQKKVVRSLPVTILPQHAHVEKWPLGELLAYEVQIEVDLPEACPAVWGLAEGELVSTHRFTTQEMSRVQEPASQRKATTGTQAHLFSTGPVENPNGTSQDLLISTANYDRTRCLTVEVRVFSLEGKKRVVGMHTVTLPPLGIDLGSIELQGVERFEVQVKTDGPHAVVDLFGTGYVMRETLSPDDAYSQQPIEAHRFTHKQLVMLASKSYNNKKQAHLSQPTLFRQKPAKAAGGKRKMNSLR